MEHISFEWGTIPKSLPADKEELKQQLEQYLIPAQGTKSNERFLTNLRIAKRSARRKDQEDLLMQHIDAMFDEVMSGNAYNFLQEGEGFNRLLEKDPSGKAKQKSKEELMKITLAQLAKDSQITNDIVGFSFMRFGRDLDKIPPFPFLKKFKDIGLEGEFVFRESWSEKDQMPSGNYSYSSSNNKDVEHNAVIEIPPESAEKIADEKSKYIKEKGVRSARYITKGHSKAKVMRKLFDFPIQIKGLEEYQKKAFDSIMVREGDNPTSITNLFEGEELAAVAAMIAGVKADKRKTNKKFSYDGKEYDIVSFGIYGEGKSNLGTFNATAQFEQLLEKWVESNKDKLFKPVEEIMNDLETVKTVVVECNVKTTTRSKGKFFNYWKKADKALRDSKKEGKIITDDEGNPQFTEIDGEKIPMREAVDRPDLFFEVFDKEKGEYRPLTRAEAEELDKNKEYKVKEVRETDSGLDLVSIRKPEDFEDFVDVAEALPLAFMNDSLGQAKLQCEYFVTGHGYFDFSPYNRGGGSTGMNNPIKTHIDRFKVRVRKLTRQGVSVGE